MTLSLKVAMEPESPVNGPDGLFTGYDGWVWMLTIVGALSGLVVSFALKFVDNIAVISAHALAMLVVVLASAEFFDLRLTGPLAIGAILVAGALVAFYAEEDRPNAGATPGQARHQGLLPPADAGPRPLM